MAHPQMVDYHALILPFFPHHRQKDSPTCQQRDLGEWIPYSPTILGNLVGGTTQKNWMPLRNPLPCSEQPGGPFAQSKPAEPHGLQSPWGQQRWPSPERCRRGPGTPHGLSWHGTSGNTPTLYFGWGWSPFWRLPNGSPWKILQGAFSLSAFGGDALLERCLDWPLSLLLVLKLLLPGLTIGTAIWFWLGVPVSLTLWLGRLLMAVLCPWWPVVGWQPAWQPVAHCQ